MIGAIILLTVSLASAPQRLPGFAVTADDYPPFARRYEHKGVADFTVRVDDAGVPRDCAVTSSSTFAELDAKTCEIVEARMRFVPARNGQGKAVAGTYSNRVRWQLDATEQASFGDGTTVQTLSFTPDGMVARCDVKTTGMMTRQPGLFCEAVPTTALPFMLGAPLSDFAGATIVVALHAGDGPVTFEPNDYGTRKINLTAQFTVNAAGRVERCVSADTITVINQPLDVCTLISSAQTETSPAFAPGEPRHGAFGLYVYGRPRATAAERPAPPPRP